MKPRHALLAIASVLVVVAGVFGGKWYADYAKREAFVQSCLEDGAGTMFPSRKRCGDLYDRDGRNR